MKTIKNILVIIIMALMAISAQAQEQLTVSVYQDAKLLVSGDNKGNDAFTPNIIARLNTQGNQQKWGYMVVFPEFEFARLKGDSYKRYSANVGYTFNKLIVNNLELAASGGWGWINREGITDHSWAINGAINYKINSRFKICIMGQLAQRNDLELAVNRASGFVGLEITLF